VEELPGAGAGALLALEGALTAPLTAVPRVPRLVVVSFFGEGAAAVSETDATASSSRVVCQWTEIEMDKLALVILSSQTGTLNITGISVWQLRHWLQCLQLLDLIRHKCKQQQHVGQQLLYWEQ
jgi:hypothetical protein